MLDLTGRPRDVMKNLETPGKTRRVGRYDYIGICRCEGCGLDLGLLATR